MQKGPSADDANIGTSYGLDMPSDAAVGPSKPFLPPRWFIKLAWKIHRALYRWTGGRFGLRSPRVDRYGLAELTTTGRRSGQPRSVMIGYYQDGHDLVTMAMNGWGAAEPAWWLNLQADPRATLTTSEGPIVVAGRAAIAGERDRLWDRWRELDAELDGFASRRSTQTAVVILSPEDEIAPVDRRD